MKKLICVLALASCAFGASDDAANRLQQAADTVKSMTGTGDKAIPLSVFQKAVCAVVVPNLKKGGFIVGAKYGRGFVSCRKAGGGWSAPSAVRIEGGSFGLQAGGAESDIILLVMNEKGMQRLLTSKFTIGGDATAAAGPVGRDASAQTDAMMTAEILSWSQSRGVFAGVSLDGSTLRPDTDVNKKLYGADADPKTILSGDAKLTPEAKHFLDQLVQSGGAARAK
jgi:lipid-binding SYLF domain-containing protein